MNEIALRPCEENDLTTRELVSKARVEILAIGMLVAENQAKAYWSLLEWGSFKDWVESLGLFSYSYFMRIVGVLEMLKTSISLEDFNEMGITKATLLLPVSKAGNLDKDTIAIALASPVSDLKEHLGHKMALMPKGEELFCPRCGERLYGLKRVK
ncbi:hypothetical protein LCGC14_1884550 [marine sediment metagenome]|uniref:Uncharacterized protein n=1 Tax=marine sediment metagenome TaxID=412755 RepID=A0A0F9IZK0_9ZZZZ